MQHVYVSTYCQHEQHNNCRLKCKICEAPCRCWCHWPDPTAKHQLRDEEGYPISG